MTVTHPPRLDLGLDLPPLASEIAGAPPADPVAGLAEQQIATARDGMTLAFYAGRSGYDLQETLEPLAYRAIEPNLFFDPRFLAPAMPRLDDRQVRLALLLDERQGRQVRLMLPFTIEKPGFAVGPSIMRCWSHIFGPLGTPLVDSADAAESLDLLVETLGRPEARLPQVLVLPDLRLDGQFARLARAIALSRDLPLATVNRFERAMLESYDEGEVYLRRTVSAHHLREIRRQERQLARRGALDYQVYRQPDDVRRAMEAFLVLEASGWKGRKRTAMMSDRLHAAFAREAVSNLAAEDHVRIHLLTLNDQPIAAMIVFLEGGEAYTWKTAFDERYAAYSPGKLLMQKLTGWNLDDANIRRTDSLAHSDHPMMGRFWSEREAMGTLIIGLGRNSDRDVRQAAAQLHLYRNTRNLARALRQKIRSLTGRP